MGGVFLIVLLALALDAVLRFVLLRGVKRLVLRTRAKWDDVLFSDRVLRRMSHILTPMLIYVLLPVAFPRESEALHILVRLTQIAIVVVIFRFVSALIYTAFEFVSERPAWEGKPIKGLRQTKVRGIALLICTILVVSILLGKSPAFLLTGLGASAAVIMLIFRDSILGFVSGIQLSANNNMLRVGDWIAMPKVRRRRCGGECR